MLPIKMLLNGNSIAAKYISVIIPTIKLIRTMPTSTKKIIISLIQL